MNCFAEKINICPGRVIKLCGTLRFKMLYKLDQISKLITNKLKTKHNSSEIMISKNLILGLAVATVMTAAIDITSTTKDNKWSNDNLRNTSMNTFKGTHLGNIEDSYPGWVTGNKPTLELEIFFDFNSEDIGLLRDNTRHFVNLAV